MYIGVCLLGMVEVRGTRGQGRGARGGVTNFVFSTLVLASSVCSCESRYSEDRYIKT